MTNIFDTSELYHLFLNSNNDINEVQKIFLNKIQEFGFTESQIKDFLNDYQNNTI